MTYTFKTTINCGGCLAKVEPHLNAEENIKEWNVDINNPDKLLTVETDNLEQVDIKALVESLGFRAEPIS